MENESDEQNMATLLKKTANSFKSLTKEYDIFEKAFLKVEERYQSKYLQSMIQYENQHHHLLKELSDSNVSDKDKRYLALHERILTKALFIKKIISNVRENTEISNCVKISTVKNMAFFGRFNSSIYKLGLKPSKIYKKGQKPPATIFKVSVEIPLNTRIDNEAKMLSEIKHQNIISILYSGTVRDTNRSFIALEYMRNGNLQENLGEAKDKLSASYRLTIARDIINALYYLSLVNIIHHDVKPQNVLLGENQSVKLADFDLAKEESVCDCISGTFHWMAPEVFSGKVHNHLSDIFGFGLVLWCLAHDTDKSPWHSISLPFNLQNASYYPKYWHIIMRTDLTPKINPIAKKADEIKNLITSCLSRNPTERTGAFEAKQALSEITAEKFDCFKP